MSFISVFSLNVVFIKQISPQLISIQILLNFHQCGTGIGQMLMLGFFNPYIEIQKICIKKNSRCKLIKNFNFIGDMSIYADRNHN